MNQYPASLINKPCVTSLEMCYAKVKLKAERKCTQGENTCKSISESSSTSRPELKLQVQPDRPRNLDLPLHLDLLEEVQVVDESDTYMTEELDISTD